MVLEKERGLLMEGLRGGGWHGGYADGRGVGEEGNYSYGSEM